MVNIDDLRVLEPCQKFLNSTCSNKKADKVPRTSPISNEVGVGKNHKSKIAVHDKAEELELSSGGGVDSNSAAKPSSMQCSQVEIGDRVEMDVNQVTQSAPDSPLFCDIKGSDNDCSDQDSEQVSNFLLFVVLIICVVKSSLPYFVGQILFQFGTPFS